MTLKGAKDATNGTIEHGSVERSSKKLQLKEDRVSLKMPSTSQNSKDKKLHGLMVSSESSLRYQQGGSSSQPSHANDEGNNTISSLVSEEGRKIITKRDTSDQQQNFKARKRFQFLPDITKGTENVEISLVDEIGGAKLPRFNYIPHNIAYEHAEIRISLARIADDDCCSTCTGDCLSPSKYPCACARETSGVFAYTPEGLLEEKFLNDSMSTTLAPQKHQYVYCMDCPLERVKNEFKPEPCKGHLVRKFIKECWRKCGCDMQCGNRVVQRGITRNLQVFNTQEGKGWGLRTLENLPRGSFVCEYVGEILTNSELYERNLQCSGNERHTYPVMLDADWCSEKILRDDEALCLDATYQGNVARFINHRCDDANLTEIPVEVETPDRHYYHLAFFTNRNVDAYEELTWDYGIDFADNKHPVKAFRCCCGSVYCRDKKRKGSKLTSKRQKTEGIKIQ